MHFSYPLTGISTLPAVLVLFFLLVSETSPPWTAVTRFFLRYFPPLSEESGVGFLGLAMMWVATSVLSQE